MLGLLSGMTNGGWDNQAIAAVNWKKAFDCVPPTWRYLVARVPYKVNVYFYDRH
jgi:hypothetical protein